MIEIRNLKFQPLTLHLANSKRTVHLASRGKAEIDDRDLSDEIRNAAQKGFLALRELKRARQSKPAISRLTESHQPAKPKATVKGTSEAKDTKGGKAT